MPSLGFTHLDTAVAPVSHDDVPIGVHSYSRWGVKLPIALAMGAKLEEELSIGTVHLAGQKAGDWGSWPWAEGGVLKEDRVKPQG